MNKYLINNVNILHIERYSIKMPSHTCFQRSMGISSNSFPADADQRLGKNHTSCGTYNGVSRSTNSCRPWNKNECGMQAGWKSRLFSLQTLTTFFNWLNVQGGRGWAYDMLCGTTWSLKSRCALSFWGQNWYHGDQQRRARGTSSDYCCKYLTKYKRAGCPDLCVAHCVRQTYLRCVGTYPKCHIWWLVDYR